MKPILKVCLRILFVLLWGIVILSFHQKYSHQEIFINKLPQSYRIQTDSILGGESTCKSSQEGEVTTFEYNLSEKKNFYAFVNYIIVFEEPLDVSNFDNFEYTLKGDYLNTLSLFFRLEPPEGSLYPTYSVATFKEYGTKFQKFKIPLQEFKYDEAWMKYGNIKEKDLGAIDFTHLKSIVFESGERSEPKRPESFSFHSIKFTKTLYWPYFIIIGLLIFVLIYWWVIDKEKKKPVTVSIKYSAVNEVEKGKFFTVFQYITKNYTDPLISVTKVCKDLDISEEKLNTELKKESTLTFKYFLNQLRIQEAKRLLRETNSRISDIGKNVGYENITHFNRVFKKEIGSTPSEYRKRSGKQ